MKETMDHIKDIKSLPTMIMYGTKDKILETTAICEFKDKFKSNELYF